MNIKTILFIIFFASTAPVVLAQNANWETVNTEDYVLFIKDIETFYNSKPSMRCNLFTNLYEDRFSSKSLESSWGDFIRQDNYLYSFMYGVKTIQNNKIRLTVDTLEKVLVITDVKSTQMESPFTNIKDINFLANNIQSILKTKVNDINILKINFIDNEEINYLELYYTQTLNKINVYYNAKIDEDLSASATPKLEMQFLNQIFTPIKNTEIFSIAKYVKDIGNNKYSPMPQYSNYEFFDQRLKQ